MKKIITLLTVLTFLLGASGCGFLSEEKIKLRDLDFTILSEEVIPEELKSLIEEKKQEPFMLTYSDQESLYICKGYGKQPSGGFSITVSELYLTDDAIYAKTSLLGPSKDEDTGNTETFPYIVIRTEKLDKTVIFE